MKDLTNSIMKTKEEIEEFIVMHIPFFVKTESPKAKAKFVYAFSSAHAHEKVIKGLTDKLFKELNKEV